ncbi:Peroxisomal membrane protein PAS20 [Ascosphaera pollenicola]|nr:Peroxisomal membrane protein PAS20 [Ascosphaera pollenicola]
MPPHTLPPEETAWNLPTLPSAIQDAELGPFFSDMVTADDDPYSIPLPAGYEARQWNDLDISLPPGHVEPPDGLFGGMIPGAEFDLNFDFDFNNSFLPDLPDIAFPPITEMPHMPEPMDNTSVGLQSIGPLNPDGSADVAPAPAEHFQSQGHSFMMATQFSQATVTNEPQKSPPKTSVPFDSSAFGQYRSAAPRLNPLDALNSQAIQTSNAPKIDINFTPNCNPRQGPSSNPTALSQSITNPMIGLGKGPTSTHSSSEDSESSEEPIGDHGYDDNAHNRKRRWSPVAENNVSVERTSALPDAYEAEAARRQYTDLLGALLGSLKERSFQGAFTMQRSTLPVFTKAEDDIELAQLIVEVTTQSCFCHTGTAFSDLSDSRRQRIIASKIFTPFSPEVRSHVPDMKELAGLGNVREQLTLRPAATPPPFTRFSQPYIKVRREGQGLEALAAISSFWDTFELEPFYGAKDVKAICIYPEIAVNETREFCASMKQVYEGNLFGKHEDLLMIPWRYREDQAETPYLGVMEALLSLCIGIASRVPRNDENVVIYIFNAFTSNGAISDICHCFLRLRKEYCSLLGTAATPISGDNILLQIVPLDFIFNPLSLVVPSREDLHHLSMEIYYRCPPQPKTDFPKSFPIYLSIKWMTPVNIRCTPQATPPFVNTQSLLHVAYSQSADLRWVTAAWTDYQGHYQATVSFCLRKEGSAESVSPRDVRHHIWMITMDIMQAAKLNSHVIITRDGPYDGAELGDWCSLIDNYNRSISRKIEVSFIAVDVYPGLYAKVPSPPKTPSGVSSSTTNQGSVPSSERKPASSTSQAEGSHGHTELPSTPTVQTPKTPKQLSQSRAYDKLDQAWAVLLSHRPNFTSEVSRYSSVKASGYLVYPDALNDNEGLAVLVAHVIHPPRRSAEVFLLRILQSFRQLATLSKVRGLNSSQHGHPLPWHIATAIRGQEVLSQTL